MSFKKKNTHVLWITEFNKSSAPQQEPDKPLLKFIKNIEKYFNRNLPSLFGKHDKSLFKESAV